MNQTKHLRSMTPLFIVGLSFTSFGIAQAQRGVTQDDAAAVRAQRRAAVQAMTPDQRQQYFQNRRAEFQQRLANMTPAERAAFQAQRQQQMLANMTPEQRAAFLQYQAQQQAEEKLDRSLMDEVGITDKATQDAIIQYLRREEFAKGNLLDMAQKAAAGIKDKTVKDDDLAKQLTDFRQAVADDKDRHDTALANLDKTVSYTTKPRIEAFLAMLSATNQEAARVAAPAVLFADAKPATAQAATTTPDAQKARADQERAFMNVLELTDKDTQDAVVAFVQKENDARLPLLATAQKLTSIMKVQPAGTNVQAAVEGDGDKATVKTAADTTAPAGDGAAPAPASDADIAAQLAEFHREAGDDKTRYDGDLAELDKQVSYSTKPRLGVFLTMVDLIGDEASYVGGPAAIFGPPRPQFGRGRGRNGGNGGNGAAPDGLPNANAPAPLLTNVGADGLPNLGANAGGDANAAVGANAPGGAVNPAPAA